MNTRLLAILAFTGLFLMSCSGDDSQAEIGGPRLYAAELSHDFGTVFAGAIKTATFELENRGNQELVITRALKDCGCTKPSFSRKRLAPGQNATMTVTLVAPAFHGNLNKRIRVHTNDPHQGETVFRLKMRGMGKASISPETIELGNVWKMDGEEVAFPFDLVLPKGTFVDGLSVRGDSSFVHGRIVTGRGTNKAKFEIVFEGLREEVAFRDYLQLDVTTTDEAGKKKVVQPQGIQIKGVLSPAVLVRPSLIDLGRIRNGQTCSISCLLLDQEESDIVDVRWQSDGPLVAIDSNSKGNQLDVDCQVKAKTGRLFSHALVTLRSGHTVDLPIIGWVEDGP